MNLEREKEDMGYYEWLSEIFGRRFKREYKNGKYYNEFLKEDGVFDRTLYSYENSLSLFEIFKKLNKNRVIKVLVREGARCEETTLTSDHLPKVKVFGCNFKTLLDFNEIQVLN